MKRFGGSGWKAAGLFILALGGLVFAVPARAADTKIGVIDSQRIFSEFQEAKDAEAVFQQEMQQWQSDLEELERQIVSQQEKIRSQALLLSKEKLNELQQELDGQLRTYESQKNDILDPTRGKAVTRNQELSAPINEKIATVVERIGTEGGYTLILDVATVNVVFQAEGVDITDRVLEELEKTGN